MEEKDNEIKELKKEVKSLKEKEKKRKTSEEDSKRLLTAFITGLVGSATIIFAIPGYIAAIVMLCKIKKKGFLAYLLLVLDCILVLSITASFLSYTLGAAAAS